MGGNTTEYDQSCCFKVLSHQCVMVGTQAVTQLSPLSSSSGEPRPAAAAACVTGSQSSMECLWWSVVGSPAPNPSQNWAAARRVAGGRPLQYPSLTTHLQCKPSNMTIVVVLTNPAADKLKLGVEFPGGSTGGGGEVDVYSSRFVEWVHWIVVVWRIAECIRRWANEPGSW